jgi:hypothetical protein
MIRAEFLGAFFFAFLGRRDEKRSIREDRREPEPMKNRPPKEILSLAGFRREEANWG